MNSSPDKNAPKPVLNLFSNEDEFRKRGLKAAA